MNRLCGLVAEILGVDVGEVNPETGPLVLPPWDSLNHMRLVAAIEETYSVQLTTDEITNVLSVSDFATLLRERGVRVD
jgi:acyl carrier protein